MSASAHTTIFAKQYFFLSSLLSLCVQNLEGRQFAPFLLSVVSLENPLPFTAHPKLSFYLSYTCAFVILYMQLAPSDKTCIRQQFLWKNVSSFCFLHSVNKSKSKPKPKNKNKNKNKCKPIHLQKNHSL